MFYKQNIVLIQIMQLTCHAVKNRTVLTLDISMVKLYL